MSATKVGENTTNIPKLLFFTMNLHFVTSSQISAFEYLICLSQAVFISSSYLQKCKGTQTDQSICHAFSYFVRKETTHKPLKVAILKSEKVLKVTFKTWLYHLIKSIMTLNLKHIAKLQRYRNKNTKKQKHEKLKHRKTKIWFYQKNRWKMQTFINPC